MDSSPEQRINRTIGAKRIFGELRALADKLGREIEYEWGGPHYRHRDDEEELEDFYEYEDGYGVKYELILPKEKVGLDEDSSINLWVCYVLGGPEDEFRADLPCYVDYMALYIGPEGPCSHDEAFEADYSLLGGINCRINEMENDETRFRAKQMS